MKLIDNWKTSWKLWSVRLNAIGVALISWPLIDPASALFLYNAMPYEVRSLLPAHVSTVIAILVFVGATVARIVRQDKYNAPPQRRRRTPPAA